MSAVVKPSEGALLEQRHQLDVLDESFAHLAPGYPDTSNPVDAKDQRIAELEKALIKATGKTYREAARLLEDTGRDDDSVSLLDNMADAFEPGGTAAVTS